MINEIKLERKLEEKDKILEENKKALEEKDNIIKRLKEQIKGSK